MTRVTKTKSVAAPAAQSREEVESLIESIGIQQRELQRQEADLGDRLAEAKRDAETRALPLKESIADAQDRISRWCEANRAELTKGGKTKTVEFTTGAVSWRLRPPRVTVRGGEQAVIDWLQKNLAGRFIRTKLELDKEALRSTPEMVPSIPGVKVGSAGEDFIVEPFAGQLVEGV